METTIKNKSGESVNLTVMAYPLFDDEENFSGGVELFRDITEIKRMERERKNILSMFAHDMKSPITTAEGFLSRLLLDKAGPLIAGAVLAYFSFNQVIWLKDFLIPFTAGGFIYIALVDMMPELHKKAKGGKIAAQSGLIIIGIGLMWWLRVIFEH